MTLYRRLVLFLIVSAVLHGLSDVCHAMSIRTTNSKPSPKNRDNSMKISGGQGQRQRRQVLQSIMASFSGMTVAFTNHPKPALSLSPEEASTAYDSYASNYDSLDGGTASSIFGIDQARSDLFGKASGNVLEICAGTGLNLEKYNLSQLESLTLLDISEGMLLEAQKRVSTLPAFSDIKIGISFVKADATSDLVSKFGIGSFDTVVDSFSLCTMGNEGAKRCLDQVRQVVKSKQDGGKRNSTWPEFAKCRFC